MSLVKMKKLYFFFTLIAIILPLRVNAGCQNPAPRPQPLNVPANHPCPGGWSKSGDVCIPSSSSATYAFVKRSNQSCPSNYSTLGDLCIANIGACYAYWNGSGNCPSGFSSLGDICIAN